MEDNVYIEGFDSYFEQGSNPYQEKTLHDTWDAGYNCAARIEEDYQCGA